MSATDPFVGFKAAQREVWASFAALDGGTVVPASQLVQFAGVGPGERVLDVGTGTGAAAITAARLGAEVSGLDLTPALLERAAQNAAIAGVEVDFTAGDAEALPYPDTTFDVVLSQFGHMFAPRPEVAIAEMLRVLKPSGRVAFATWPPESPMGRLFALAARSQPPLPAGAPVPAPVVQWGDPEVVRTRLGGGLKDVVFDRGAMVVPALSPGHARATLETTFGPLVRVLAALQGNPERVASLRAEVGALVGEAWSGNQLRLPFLLTRARRRE